ncbi:MAG: hypothetical protein ABFC90_10555 [Bacteroidales bacterium]|nr:hypothetical protein [Bacteroidales bacterium]MEA4840917.1 hypothetical protein [Bacteroidales bacterium]
MDVSIEYYGGYVSEFKGSLVDFFVVLVFLLGIAAIILILYHLYLLKQCRQKEYWLPIVDDGGNVIGRVARSVSYETPGKYQHPLIRILISKDRSIYLAPRPFDFCPEYGLYDHPIEYLMEFGKSIEESISELQKKHFPNSPQPRFLLKYKHENKFGSWQVLLYILRIEDEEDLMGFDKSKGKFWTIPQLQENFGKSCFSSCLEGELDFIRTINDIN